MEYSTNMAENQQDAVEVKKCCIIGTAPSYKLAPWGDPTIEFWTLNDAYLLGLPRSDRHYDLHPFNKFVFRSPKQHKVLASEMPAGTYLRPEGHIQWLARQTCPVFVQKQDPRTPHAQVFPVDQVVAHFGRHFDSTPAYLVAHAILEGYKEIHVYGIHLATEWEYLKQRASFEWILGVAAGMGLKVVMPSESPVLRSTHLYAFEEDPANATTNAQRAGERVQQEREAVVQALKKSKRWWRPRGNQLLRDRADWLAAQQQDAQMAVQWETYRKRALVG
jgi:hypothetical protein